MAMFKNDTGHAVDIPLFELHIGDGDTFEVPDEHAASFEAQPGFTKSRTQNPTVTPDPAVVAAVTGPIPVSAETVPAPTNTTN